MTDTPQTSTPTTASLEALQYELAAYYAALAVLVDECYKPGTGYQMLGLSQTGPITVSDVDVRATRIGKMLPVWFRYAYDGVMSAGFSLNSISLADSPFERLRDMVSLLQVNDAYFEDCLAVVHADLDVVRVGRLAELVARVEARYSLDDGADMSLAELATLADMNERSVRNAVTASGENRLALKDDGRVSNAEARRWLAKRRGFTATQFRSLPTHTNELPDALDAVEIPKFIERRLDLVHRESASLHQKSSELTGRPVWMYAAQEETELSFERLEELTQLPFDVKPSECELLAKTLRVDPVWFTYQVMTALFPRELDMLMNPAAWRAASPTVTVVEPEVLAVTVELTRSMLAHGYIDIPSSASSLFPPDCFGTRASGDEGAQVELVYGGHRAMTDIRKKSEKTISPRRRFTSWLNTELGAKPGDRIRIEKVNERTFSLNHIPS